MKWTEILKKAEKIENTYVIVKEPTKHEYGRAVKLSGDPVVVITSIDTTSGNRWDFKIGRKKYDTYGKITIDIDDWDKLDKEVRKLIDKSD